MRNLIAIFYLFAAFGAAQAAPSPVVVTLKEQRDYGYTLGDIVTLTIDIEAPYYYQLEKSFLPEPGPVTSWLELKSIRIDDSIEAADYRLIIAYQVFKSVSKTTRLTIPPMPIRFRVGTGSATAETPEWTFTYHPLISPETPDDRVLIQKELKAPRLDEKAPIRNAFYLLAAAALTLAYIAWVYGKIPFLERYAGAFGRACSELDKIAKQPYSDARYRKALQCFHRALNETSGETVFSERLSAFFDEFPAYAPVRSQTEKLFSISGDVFFADHPVEPEKMPLDEIRALCRLCRKIERGARWV
ncbi:MAG: hypothetical protein ACU833_03900 [Gammaproteobacteria bacterium]